MAELRPHDDAAPVPFGARLRRSLDQYGPLCLGLDPHPGLVEAWGLPYTVAGLERFSRTVVEAAAGHVGVLKPQVALYECFGAAGFAVLERVLTDARAAGLLTIADAKRGDIGSTMAAYASAWLEDGSPLAADAVTLSPYLGFGSLAPALELAQRTGRGIFVLALTSNPEGASVQHVGGEASVAGAVMDAVVEHNAREGAVRATEEDARARSDASGNRDGIVINTENAPMGSCGVVIGATVGDALERLQISLEGFNGPILSPGFGAQGADAHAVAHVFHHVSHNILANSSRGVLRHGPDLAALRAALRMASDQLRAAL